MALILAGVSFPYFSYDHSRESPSMGFAFLLPELPIKLQGNPILPGRIALKQCEAL
jgi:hypothetical protein